jgi:hypothetical protein
MFGRTFFFVGDMTRTNGKAQSLWVRKWLFVTPVCFSPKHAIFNFDNIQTKPNQTKTNNKRLLESKASANHHHLD